MQSPNFIDSRFPFVPLNRNAREAVFDLLKEFCFSPKTMIRENYPFTGIGGREFKANAIAFTHETRRTLDHTGISIFNTLGDKEESALVEILARSAAPFHFIHKNKNKTFSFWFSNIADRKSRTLECKKIESNIGYENLSNALREYSDDLKRDQILAHTGTLGSGLQKGKPEFGMLMSAANQKFPNYFDMNLVQKWWKAADSAYGILTELCYSGFSPEMLTNLYREAYPDKEVRKKLGRYDTPLYLTRRIWNTIPVEFLPPEKRTVADMTCGWGSFLIAGYERMSRMIDMEGKPLRQLITGNDKDNFTARLAGLGLLISTLEDSWDIDSKNSDIWMEKKFGRSGPGIIVGNPPFGGDRETISGKKQRFQLADAFMKHAITYLSHGGYLAMIMPQSFTISQASSNLRHFLMQNCDIQEMWELPIGVFQDAKANSIVIFARKKQAGHPSTFPVRIRTLQPHMLDTFQEKGIFTSSIIVEDQAEWDDNSKRPQRSPTSNAMDFKHILPKSSWDRIKSVATPISDIADIITGAIVGNNPERKRWRDYPDPKKVNWFRGAKDAIEESFHINYDAASTIVYPNELEEPRKDKEHLFKNKKIVLASATNPSWGKRVKVAIDRKGYYVSDSFFVVAPNQESEKKGSAHEVIAAVLNWKVGNAWIVEHHKYPRIPTNALKSIPFPALGVKDCDILTEAVIRMEKSFEKFGKTSENDLIAIDNILKSAYRLEDDEFDRLKSIYEWDTNPSITIDRLPEFGARWKTTGVVDSVDPESGTITLWISDFDELQTVPVSPSMPGWLLRPETAFRTFIPRECVRKRSLSHLYSGKFQPQDYTYLNEEELFDEIAKALS